MRRNRVDLADPEQVRAIRRRFRVSEDELTRLVAKIGNSIALIGKEVALQRAAKLTRPSEPAPIEIIAAKSSQLTEKRKVI